MLKVIVVDDEPTIRKGLVNCIDWDGLGCAVTGIFTNGHEALESIKISPPDIILTDVRMPRMNGLELTQYLYENNYKCKVIILTAFPDFNYSQEAIKYGVIDFVIKPTSPQKLIESIKKAKKIIKKEQANLITINPIQASTQGDLESIHQLILLNAINGVYSNTLIMENRLSHYGINLKNYFCLLIHANIPYPSEYDEGITHMQTYVEQVFIDTQYYLFFIDKSHIMLISLVDENLSNIESLQTVATLSKELLAMTQAFVNFEINIGISLLHHSPNELPLAYNESKTALEYKFYFNSEFIFTPSQDRASTTTSWEDHLKSIILEISKITDTYSYTDIPKYTTRFFEILKSAVYPREKADKYILLLLTYLQQLNDNIPASHKHIERFMIMQNEIYNAYNIHIIYEIITSYVEILMKELSSETLNQDLIEQINSYLQQNFSKELTLSSIAKHFHLNSSYLSRLYKKQTDENLIVALTKLRIDQAKKIMLTTDKLIYEVARDVGIEDPTYFSQVFKKYTGLNPSEYKEQKTKVNDHDFIVL